MNVKLLTEHHLEFLSLKGGYTGSSVSTLVKMSHCCKSHVAAKLYFYRLLERESSEMRKIFITELEKAVNV